ncbi:MAG TPA: hypothetical protein VNY52_00825 [Solirubrobacteraceae bacterium]|jgi:hypothetical protein|nr:hypothetical protein [Solirubrobacteraceae bacterium]
MDIGGHPNSAKEPPGIIAAVPGDELREPEVRRQIHGPHVREDLEKAKGASPEREADLPTGAIRQPGEHRHGQGRSPKQLPSRLTTLQKACTAAQFKANPAGCPAASIVGHAKAITPLIPVPPEGPAYFVSNGGNAFPNLITVL